MADICTGSGCLAILLAKHFPNAHVDVPDISEEAQEVTKLTLKIIDYRKKSDRIKTDTMNALMSGKGYDLILLAIHPTNQNQFSRKTARGF
jgi:ribosomal protein L3 glutamine methyltransferase